VVHLGRGVGVSAGEEAGRSKWEAERVGGGRLGEGGEGGGGELILPHFLFSRISPDFP
jgi:hypothetical protein